MTRSNESKNLIVSLDIGTSKIAIIVGEAKENGELEIVGLGRVSSRGMKRGIVVNIDTVVASIQKAVEEAELMTHHPIKNVITGVTGVHIKGHNRKGMIKVGGAEVTRADVDRVIETAQAVAFPMDQQILDILPQEYILDDQDGVQNPLGMSGMKLEAKVYVITGAITSTQNVMKSVKRCGLEIDNFLVQPLASGEAVLTEDEKESGVCLLDIGGGTTDIAVYRKGAICHTAVIPVAGDHITSDIALSCRVTPQFAEEIKIAHGCAKMSELVDPEKKIAVQGMDDKEGRYLITQKLSVIIEERVTELYKLVIEVLKQSNLEPMSMPFVITGGASMMKGMDTLGREIFQQRVRVGMPHGVGGLVDIVNRPDYASGVGLLLLGQSRLNSSEKSTDGAKEPLVWVKIKNLYDWVKRNF